MVHHRHAEVAADSGTSRAGPVHPDPTSGSFSDTDGAVERSGRIGGDGSSSTTPNQPSVWVALLTSSESPFTAPRSSSSGSPKVSFISASKDDAIRRSCPYVRPTRLMTGGKRSGPSTTSPASNKKITSLPDKLNTMLSVRAVCSRCRTNAGKPSQHTVWLCSRDSPRSSTDPLLLLIVERVRMPRRTLLTRSP